MRHDARVPRLSTRNWPRRVGARFAWFTLAVLPAGCNGTTVNVPPGPQSPPVAVMRITGLDGPVIQINDAGPPVNLTLTTDDSFYVGAIGTDPDGVKNIQISGEVVVTCANSDGIASQSTSELAASSPDTGNGKTASTERVTLLSMDIGSFTNGCSSGFTFRSMTGSFVVTATNFAGETDTTAPFSFQVRAATGDALPAATRKADEARKAAGKAKE